jgi:HK97 family phage prohead protease
MMKQERRFLAQEFRVEDGDKPSITGYAAKFNSRSQNLGGFYEVIIPGAFDDSIKAGDDVRALFNHDPNLILGRTPNTLKLTVDGTGLLYEVDPPNTTVARDLMVSMKRGDVTQSSFGFYCLEDDWDMDENGDIVRKVIRAQLFDVSPVTYPAYLSSTSEARSLFPDGKMEEIAAKIAEVRAAKSPQADTQTVVETAQVEEARTEDAPVVVPATEEAQRDSTDGEEEECPCQCDSCLAGDCSGCDDVDCDFDGCEECSMRTKRAAQLEELEVKVRNANTILRLRRRLRIAEVQG